MKTKEDIAEEVAATFVFCLVFCFLGAAIWWLWAPVVQDAFRYTERLLFG